MIKSKTEVIKMLNAVIRSDTFPMSSQTLKSIVGFYNTSRKVMRVNQCHFEWLLQANNVPADYRPKLVSLMFGKA